MTDLTNEDDESSVHEDALEAAVAASTAPLAGMIIL